MCAEYLLYTTGRATHPNSFDFVLMCLQSMLDVIRERYPDLERTVDSANDTTKWHRVPGYRGRYARLL